LSAVHEIKRIGGNEEMEYIIEMNQTELLAPELIQEVFSDSDRYDLALKLQNLNDLKSLQNVILVEEDKIINLDEVQSRVIKFYRRFVPLPATTHPLLPGKTRSWRVLDNRIKLLIGIGASVAANCQPCLKNVVEMARNTGIKDEEILEAIGVAKAVRRSAASKMDDYASTILKENNTSNNTDHGCGCTNGG
jgi:AhpD family alkylhydroperoxidase